MEERNLLLHKIKLDDFIVVEMKIPEILTAMELKAIMSKANKLFNLAEVPMQSQKTYRAPSVPVSSTSPSTPNRKNMKARKYHTLFSNEMCRFLAQNYNKNLDKDTIVSMFNNKFDTNLSNKQIKQKITNMATANQIDKYLSSDYVKDDEGMDYVKVKDDMKTFDFFSNLVTDENEKKRDKPGRKSAYTDAQVRTIIHFKKQGMTSREIAEQLNQVFGTRFSVMNIKDKLKHLKQIGELP